jgi:hypothetical protein
MFEWNGTTQAELPRICSVEQNFDTSSIDVKERIRAELAKPAIKQLLIPGLKAAVAVGSRGIGEIDTIIRTIVDELKKNGLEVFIVPAMGSHGGATAEGQIEYLAGYNITEKTMGVPIRSSMEVVALGEVEAGVPVLFDKLAFEEADLIVPVNRVKCHTGFRGPVESGLHKMLVIGLGNHIGAQSIHALGFARFKELIPKAGELILERVPAIKFGMAIVENAKDLPSIIEAVPSAEFKSREPELLELSRSLMPRLNFRDIDLLVVRELGKNISGAGLDPNVTGRFWMSHMEDGPLICNRIVLLDLTPESHGNAMGVGMADAISRKLLNKIDFSATYTNAITAARIEKARIPMVMKDDRDTIKIALQAIGLPPHQKPRMVIIKNTLELEHIYISEGLREEAGANPNLRISGDLREMVFDANGNLDLRFEP